MKKRLSTFLFTASYFIIHAQLTGTITNTKGEILPFANVYLHETLRSDSEDELHDHPWDNISVILEGSYLEVMPHGEEVLRKTGDVIQRKATDAHRLIIPEGGHAVSLFITGPKVRDWGFFTANGWQYWEDYIAEHPTRGLQPVATGDAS